MLKPIVAATVTSLLLLGCQPPPGGASKELTERLDKLEKKVTALEARPAAAAAAAPQAPPVQTAAYPIPLGDSVTMGAKGAPVNVVIFSDFQCPFCARVDPLLHEVIKDPELKDKVSVTFKHFPLSFHKAARPASKATLAAAEQGDKHFWTMSEKLYANQRDLTPENYIKWAGEIGLDVKKFKSDLEKNDAKYEKIIEDDMNMGQSIAKVRGTPSIFVNGWELRQRSVEGVKELVREKKIASL